MDKRLSEKLCEDFPELFVVEPGRQMTPFPMFGFEVGSGWFPLIYQVCVALDHIRQKTGDQIQVDQIKEKYGTLRFYVSGPDECDDIVDEAMEESSNICEICGRPGELRKKGWFSTKCDDHHQGQKVDLEPLILTMLETIQDQAQ